MTPPQGWGDPNIFAFLESGIGSLTPPLARGQTKVLELSVGGSPPENCVFLLLRFSVPLAQAYIYADMLSLKQSIFQVREFSAFACGKKHKKMKFLTRPLTKGQKFRAREGIRARVKRVLGMGLTPKFGQVGIGLTPPKS